MDFAGGGWEGGGEGDVIDGELLDFLVKNGKNGVIVNGILTWIDIQQKETAPDLWQAQANEHFEEKEVMEAKRILWKVCVSRLDIIGPAVNRKTDKKKATIDDIGKAMAKLKEFKALPLLLGSSNMMKRAPCYNTRPSTANASDVISRVKVLEDSLGGYMKQQSEEIKRLSQAVGALTPPGPGPAKPVRVIRERIDSVSKKHKLDEDMEVFEDIRDNVNWQPRQEESTARTFASIVGTESNRNATSGNTNRQNMMGAPQRPRRPSNLLFGNAKTGKDNVENILAANVNLVATGVAKDATADQLKEFVENKGIEVVEIELLTQFPVAARTFTFRIAIKPRDYDKAMNPDVWPYRVGVRIYKPKRIRVDQQNSWTNQSGQTGGNVDLSQQRQQGQEQQSSHQQQHYHRQQQYHRQGQQQYPQQQQQWHQRGQSYGIPPGVVTSNPFAALDTEAGRQFGN